MTPYLNFQSVILLTEYVASTPSIAIMIPVRATSIHRLHERRRRTPHLQVHKFASQCTMIRRLTHESVREMEYNTITV